MRVNGKILAAFATPIVTAVMLGGVLVGTHHTSFPPMNPPPPAPAGGAVISSPLIAASHCSNELRKPFTGVAVDKVSSDTVQAFTDATKKPVTLVEFYSSFPAKFNEAAAAKVVALKDIPLIQLNPGKFNKYAIRRISTGRDNAAIMSYARAVKKFGYCVVISFGHEMNGWWYKWGMPWNTAATFIKAWRLIHEKFAQAGADNVIWSWDPSHQYGEASPAKIASPASQWYPGSKYVDWVGLDGYLSLDNNGHAQNFREIFAQQVAYIRQVAPNKLLYLAETGVANTPAQVSQIDDLFNGIKQYGMLGLIWFEKKAKQDWRLVGRPPAVAAYLRGISGYQEPLPIDVVKQ